MTTPDRLRMAAGLGCLSVLLMLAWPVALRAQSHSGNQKLRKNYALIFGTVWDKEGHTVYGANVSIRREGDKKARWELVSDRNGEFAQRVPPGKADYVVRLEDTRSVVETTARKRKFKPGEVEARVHVDNDERADISLHLKE